MRVWRWFKAGARDAAVAATDEQAPAALLESIVATTKLGRWHR